jgi:type IV pilus assembly protein PilN
MIRINLLPVRELAAEVSRRRDLTVGLVALAATALVLLGVYFYQSSRLASLGDELATLRQEIQVLNSKLKEVADLQNKIKEFKGKHKVIEDISKQKVGPVRVMESLSAATPSGLWLTEFREASGTLVINGFALDNQTVADFLRLLENSPYFNNVELIETTKADEKTGPYKKFSIRTAVLYRAPAATSATKPQDKIVPKKGEKG